MLDISLTDLISISQGTDTSDIKFILYFGDIYEEFTPEDYLYDTPITGGATKTSEGKYVLSSMSVTLVNRDYYFSRYFYYIIPLGMLAIIYEIINGNNYERFRGRVQNVNLKEDVLTITLTA